MLRFKWASKIVVAVVACSLMTTQLAYGEAQSGLRDALLKYFGALNLIPVFLPRDQAVGDVMLPSGDYRYRANECFNMAKLKVSKPVTTNFEELILDDSIQIEGSFELGLKRLLKLSAEADGFKKKRLVISFREVTSRSVSIGSLQSAYQSKKCPQLQPLINESFIPIATPSQTLLVLSEVFYGKRAVSLELSQGANANVALQKVSDVIRDLDLHAKVETGVGTVDRVSVASSELVPISVRVAFVPRPILNTTLGGGGGASKTEGFLWEGVGQTPTKAQSDGLQLLLSEIASRTSGTDNPLRDK